MIMAQFKLRVYSDYDSEVICEISFERDTQQDAKENIWEVIIHQKDTSVYNEGGTYHTELLRKSEKDYILVSGSPSINFCFSNNTFINIKLDIPHQ